MNPTITEEQTRELIRFIGSRHSLSVEETLKVYLSQNEGRGKTVLEDNEMPIIHDLNLDLHENRTEKA